MRIFGSLNPPCRCRVRATTTMNAGEQIHVGSAAERPLRAPDLAGVVGGLDSSSFRESSEVEDHRSAFGRFVDDRPWAGAALEAWDASFGSGEQGYEGGFGSPTLSPDDGHRIREVECPTLPERYDGDLPSEAGVDDIADAPAEACSEVVWDEADDS
jgi:hypothetical protein